MTIGRVETFQKRFKSIVKASKERIGKSTAEEALDQTDKRVADLVYQLHQTQAELEAANKKVSDAEEIADFYIKTASNKVTLIFGIKSILDKLRGNE